MTAARNGGINPASFFHRGEMFGAGAIWVFHPHAFGVLEVAPSRGKGRYLLFSGKTLRTSL